MTLSKTNIYRNTGPAPPQRHGEDLHRHQQGLALARALVHLCVCICVYIYICIHNHVYYHRSTYIYIYTHMYTCITMICIDTNEDPESRGEPTQRAQQTQ